MAFKRNLSHWFDRQRGAAMSETLVSLSLLLLLGLGGVQTALLYDAKTTLNYATFEAARVGAVSHARSDAMREELGLRLAPLFGGDGSMRKAMAAITRAGLDVRNKGFTKIEIINPTIEAFDEFGRDLYDPQTDEMHFGIPNGHLRWRSRDVGSSGVNIQDANLLKIKVTYGYKLRVPLMDRLIPALMNRIDPQNIHFYTVSRIPITSVATVRMQSVAWRDEGNIHAEGRGGATPPAEEAAGQTDLPPYQEDGREGGEDDNIADGEETPAEGEGEDGTGGHNTDPDAATDHQPEDNDAPPAPILDLIDNGDDQGGPICENPTGPAARPGGIAGSHTGNPIHVVTGNKYQSETDLTALPGVLGLVFNRHYNSHSDDAGPLGHGWRHSYDVHLRVQADGYRLRQSDGRVIRFQATATPGRYTAPRVSDGRLQVSEEQITWHWRDGRQLQFNPRGQRRLQYIVHPDGQTLTLYYDPRGELFLVRDPQGRQLTLDHYRNGRIKALRDPTGQVTRYRYDQVGNLQQVTRPDGRRRIYHYDDPHDRHNLTGITDERGVRYAGWAYDARDRAILSTHAGRVGQVTLDFSTAGETRVTDSQGKLSTYRTEIRDGIALVTAIHGPGCSPCGQGDVSYRYNARLQLTELATRDGITRRYEYDAQGRTTAVTRQTADSAPRRIARYEYADETALQPSALIRPSVNPTGERRIDYRYNPRGQTTQITERGYRPESDGGYTPIQRTTRLRYDPDGNLSRIDGPREAVEDWIRFRYDSHQRLKQLNTPDGRTLRVAAYDDYGRPRQLRADGRADLTLAYNGQGRLSQVTQGTRQVRYAYDPAGHLTGLTDPDDKPTTLRYDEAGRAIGLTDADGRRLDLTLDTEGRLTRRSLSDAQGARLTGIRYRYDAQGRLSAGQSQGRQTQYRYDDQGRLSEIQDPQDPQGHTTTLAYNGLGQPVTLTQPGNRVTRLHYDANGQAAGLTDPRDNTTAQWKDDFGHLVRQTHPDTGETRYAYDPAGNRIQKSDAEGVITTYRYDAADRLIEETTPGNTTTLDYDPLTGRLARLADDNSHEAFVYDAQGRLTRHTRHIDGHRFATGYVYDPQGRRRQQRLPNGQTLTYHYYPEGNQQGRLRAITRKSLFGLREAPLIGEIDRDAGDGKSGLTFGNGLRETRQHDPLGRVTAIDHNHRLKRRYQYDAQGRISGIDYNGLLQRYDYDPQGRLTQAETPLGSYRYAYDSLGNRTQKQHDAPGCTKAAGAGCAGAATGQAGNTAVQENVYPAPGKGNRLLSQRNGATQDYAYNASGSPKKIGERRYDYDEHQRPVRLYRVDHKDKQTLVAAYTYNRFGERIKKIVYDGSKRPEVTYYLYDGHRLSAEADGQGEITAQYLYQNERPVLKLEGGAAYAIHTDHLGAPRAVSDQDGERVWSADYSPFGLIRIETQQISLNLRLPGQYHDQESSTYYNYQRDYDPHTGRYLTSDPIGLKGGLNSYAYVEGDPLGAIDPLGLFLLAFDGTWIDKNSTDPKKAITSNVELFRQYYQRANGDRSTEYIPGVGTGGPLDSLLGGGLAIGARGRIEEAVDMLKEHLRTSDDRSIDIVGFSRGAAMAREFANVILRMQADGDFDAPEYGRPFSIRFMGLFDSVSTAMADGSASNRCGFLYDYTISDRIGHVAQAYALNEHRQLFPQDAIDRHGGGGLSADRVEQGFLGAHADIGGGYNRNDQTVAQHGDLSDITLQWMLNQAEEAGVPMGALSAEHRTVSHPLLHDSGGNFDREIRYPNDPDWHEQQQPDPLNLEELPNGAPPVYQRDDPLYPQLGRYVEDDTAQAGANGAHGILGAVDMARYDQWLNQNRGVDVLH
ncbi:MAG: DUF2235 domain-containing protein [Candidatus Thiodiazotropha sp. (ex Epidulcina cf. delphinae)]|nr:DUF2235 domain-containing protein [Candidatus Thiodiazotropha sp. (ex Epidulcina cf. delphinae)]